MLDTHLLRRACAMTDRTGLESTTERVGNLGMARFLSASVIATSGPYQMPSRNRYARTVVNIFRNKGVVESVEQSREGLLPCACAPGRKGTMRRLLRSSRPRLEAGCLPVPGSATLNAILGTILGTLDRAVVRVVMLMPVLGVMLLRRRRERVMLRLRPPARVNPLFFQKFHNVKPVELVCNVREFFFEFWIVKPWRISPLHHALSRQLLIGSEITVLIKVPVPQFLIKSTHSGRFAILVSKLLEPNILEIFGHIDYLSVKR